MVYDSPPVRVEELFPAKSDGHGHLGFTARAVCYNCIAGYHEGFSHFSAAEAVRKVRDQVGRCRLEAITHIQRERRISGTKH